MKTLIAHKVKDGWLVEVKETRHIQTKSDVLKMVKQNGLEVKEPEDGRIYAD